jgi:hypothetical protein
MANYQINPSYVFAQHGPDRVKVVSLDLADQQLYTISGVSAQVFIKLVNGVEPDEVKQSIQQLEHAPPREEVDQFVEKFIADLEGLNILQAR